MTVGLPDQLSRMSTIIDDTERLFSIQYLLSDARVFEHPNLRTSTLFSER